MQYNKIEMIKIDNKDYLLSHLYGKYILSGPLSSGGSVARKFNRICEFVSEAEAREYVNQLKGV